MGGEAGFKRYHREEARGTGLGRGEGGGVGGIGRREMILRLIMSECEGVSEDELVEKGRGAGAGEGVEGGRGERKNRSILFGRGWAVRRPLWGAEGGENNSRGTQ